MDGSKIKNFVICLLAAVNLIFLGLLIAEEVQSSKLQRQILEDLQSILAENGVDMDMNTLPESSRYAAYPLSRDAEAEAAMAAAILGPVEGEDQGGNIFHYQNDAGLARFRGNGEFEILPAAPLSDPDMTESTFARHILDKLALNTGTEAAVSRDESGATQLTYPCLLEEQLLYDCFVTLRFEEGGLVSVSGRRPIGESGRAGSETELNPATAILSLLSYTRDSGHVFSAINGLDVGYIMQVSVSGSAELIPIWCLETDSGTFYVNSVTLSVSTQPL